MAPQPLPARLDTAAARPLAIALLSELDGRVPLALDGSAVEAIGQACLQVLAAARTTAQSRGLDFSISEPSRQLREACALGGLARLLAPAA